MNKATGLLVIPLLAASLIHAAPAQAADATQQICESKYSASNFRTTSNVYWRPGECKTIKKGTQIQIDDPSYTVGYDYGPYSECRLGGRHFVPYQTPKVIYFRTYDKDDCTNHYS